MNNQSHRVKQIMEKIFTIITQEANKRRGTGCSGRTDDVDAVLLETQVRFYKLGMEGQLPAEWQSYFDQATREEDPEYATYLRLKKKFG